MGDLQRLVFQLLDVCQQAGVAICQHYAAPGADEYQSKEDDSPLTHADLESDRILQAGLGLLEPQLPVLSEESSEKDLANRRSWQRYWLVDPLDGTKEFLARTGEFTINIALVEDHRPVLGLLYLPLEEVAYAGISGQGATRYQRLPGGGWDGRKISARPLREGVPMVVLASRRHRGAALQGCLQWLDRHWSRIERINSGSALKFCQMAAGEGDFYPRFARCCEWDTAAGQAVLEAAGGKVLGLDGRPLQYNRSESLYSAPFYAIADSLHPLWQDLIADG